MIFEAAELKHAVSKREFEEREKELRTALLAAQRSLRTSNRSVLIVVAGVEGAGKGAVVDRLNEWLDARGIRTHAFWETSDEASERPRYWQFWRALPPRGSMSVMFGSWYTPPIVDHVVGKLDAAEFDRELHRITRFEQMLQADGTIIVKFWFHLSKTIQKQRLESEIKAGSANRGTRTAKAYSERYEDFLLAAERTIGTTDSPDCPWFVVSALDARYRDLTVGATLLRCILETSGQPETARSGPSAPMPAGQPTVHGDAEPPDLPGTRTTLLDAVDLSRKVDRASYRKRLPKLQRELTELSWRMHDRNRNLIAVFEGWDAAGKGGAIRRITHAVDARLYQVISVSAPTDEERAHHYLWRFWRHVPRAGYMRLYDRSWYGRVLVERVENFATPNEWMRAFGEINEFESQLVDHGIALAKFWLHLSPEEQLERFEERQRTPWKQHKLTDEDWRNRARWPQYEAAVNEMVARTSTAHAPWTVVAGNCKRHARLEVVETVRDRLAELAGG